jgi:hypothetical protein
VACPWLVGGGIKPGYSHGATDDFGYWAADRVVAVYDLMATLCSRWGSTTAS